MITRRRFVVALGAGTFVAPRLVFPQQPAKVFQIGLLSSETASGYRSQMEALRAGLRDVGYVDGKNIVIDYRWAEGKYERLPELAAELVRLKIDVLVSQGTPATLAAKRATTTIPIVMPAVGDAIATGIVASLARPGGNITGSTFFVPELNAKRLELLKEAVPRMTRVAVLLNPDNPVSRPVFQAMETTAKSLKMELQRYEARGPDEFENAFSVMAKRRVEAVAIPEHSIYVANAGMIADLAAKKRIPLVGFPQIAEVGGLIGYGVNILELYRRAGYFVDKILKGAKPGDIPVERPTKFELVVNRKTAKALGITIPQSLLQRADKVVE